ncbi:hypothetical protein PY093_20615 [Cytobacillus sp. S13-E01]|uniref:hypothetical protein n=1 Tax=Cytobacillus sp. S13-E01 TaxID=3031326 RepID=UPI0023D88FED|nr:hypothetical protein [Cytobacillus sp. S13-E01]MDF0729014.1 hypothetical protein [Cytobacillus sp. S13-E01]
MAYISGVSEYTQILQVTKAKIENMQIAQRNMHDSGIVDLDTNRLTTVLGTVASVLSFAFLQSTAGGAAIATVGVASALAPNPKEILKDLVYEGYWNMGYIEEVFNNPKYDLVEAEFPFIEYVVDGKTIRFVMGPAAVLRVRTTDGYWEVRS